MDCALRAHNTDSGSSRPSSIAITRIRCGCDSDDAQFISVDDESEREDMRCPSIPPQDAARRRRCRVSKPRIISPEWDLDERLVQNNTDACYEGPDPTRRAGFTNPAGARSGAPFPAHLDCDRTRFRRGRCAPDRPQSPAWHSTRARRSDPARGVRRTARGTSGPDRFAEAGADRLRPGACRAATTGAARCRN